MFVYISTRQCCRIRIADLSLRESVFPLANLLLSSFILNSFVLSLQSPFSRSLALPIPLPLSHQFSGSSQEQLVA